MSMDANLDIKAMERVRCAAEATMAQLVPTAQQVTQDYTVYRAVPLSNTFLNFSDVIQSHSMHKRRSRSIVGYLPVKDGTISSRESKDSAPDHGVTVEPSKEVASSIQGDEGTNAEVAQTNISCGSSDNISQCSDGAETLSDAGAKFTTIMLQNLPQAFQQADLLEAMDLCGLKGTYNFCYVPASFRDASCRGYAFINFTKHTSAASFLSAWQGSTRFCDKYHRKPVTTAIAGVQGLEALLAQPSMKKLQRIKNPAFRPFVATSASI